MLHEFAIEPDAIAESWETFRYIFEKFSVDQGRVISRFPKKWAGIVYENTDGRLGWLDRQRVQEKLARGSNNIIPFGRSFIMHGDSWRNQALAAHAKDPFDGVILKEGLDDEPRVKSNKEIDEAFFTCRREVDVRRKGSDIAEALQPLLSCSAHVMLIDRYFDPRKKWWTIPLVAIMEAAKDGSRSCHEVEYHIRWKDVTNEYDAWEKNFEENCREYLARLIPDKVRLKIVRWDDSEAKNKIHERYVLTDIGGVSIDPGLDESSRKDTTKITILEYETWQSRRQDFLGNGGLKLVDEVTVP